MKKVILLLLCMFCLAGCTEQEEIAELKCVVEGSYAYQVEGLDRTYAPGEEVTIHLWNVTEQYYTVTVNGVPVGMDPDPSNPDPNSDYVYYTFFMPNQDAVIVIEEHWVDIPYA